MPITPTYPGVYVEEIPSGVHTITGVSTSVTAFVGAAKRGPLNKAVRILSYSDFERSFGGLDAGSELSYAVRQFFLNGGSDAWIVRLAKNAAPASIELKNGNDQNVLKVQALNEGNSGNGIGVQVDHQTSSPTNTFNLTISYTSQDNPSDRISETFKNLSMNARDANYVLSVVNGVSQLITIQRLVEPSNANGTGTSVSGALTDIDGLVDDYHNEFQVVVNGASPVTVKITTLEGDNAESKFGYLCDRIADQVKQAANGNTALSNFRCERQDNTIVLTSGEPGEASSVRVLPGIRNDLSARLKLGTLNGGIETDAVAVFRPAQTPPSSQPAQTPPGIRLVGGHETPYKADDANALSLFVANRDERKGIYALESVDLFNILCLPGVTNPGILADAQAYCKSRRAFLIADAPPTAKTPADIPAPIQALQKTEYGAVYYPWIYIADPLNNGKLRLTAPSGTIAGLYARTDSTRGVWKAPAGTEANLVGVQALDYRLTDAENGTLNPLGVNCIRLLPAYGAVAWGARTLRGSDDAGSEYKYIPVRRLALMIEESLYRGSQWIVFEPNDESLWAQIRLNLGAFMHNLFRQGAFQGKSPREAYFVKCDSETTTQSDINLGIVNILVGFAPLKPAEFVIIQIQQMAGQIQA
ncbi:MAG TPA: phage tail sheath C-terminal domain-containing protein [Trichocoleus sp.]|jgi:phage tail sheath protein FI